MNNMMQHFSSNFLGTLLTAKLKFNLDHHLNITEISWLITISRMIFAQNFVSFVAADSTIIAETGSFFESLFFMITFSGGSEFIIAIVLLRLIMVTPLKVLLQYYFGFLLFSSSVSQLLFWMSAT
jgi:hypothetical protein